MTERSMALSANRWAYSLSPIDANHSVMPFMAVALGRNVYPQKHDQDDQDRIHHDPHDVGSVIPHAAVAERDGGADAAAIRSVEPRLFLGLRRRRSDQH